MRSMFRLATASRTAPVCTWLALCSLALAPAASAADWPQFRGPDRHGTITEPDLVRSWKDASPRKVWSREIGSGFSAVSAVDGRLYTMAARGEEEVALALDAATGEEIWSTAVGKPISSEFGDGPRSTPTVVDGTVYTATSDSKLVALSARDGKLIWSQDLSQWKTGPRFGYSSSPLVEGDRVITEIGGAEEGPGIAAFRRGDGELDWTALSAPAGYSSPIAIDLAGTRQIIVSRPSEVAALSPAGELLWRYETGRRAAIPMPIFLPPDRLFVSAPDDTFGGVTLRVTKGDDGYSVEPAWSERRMRNHFNSSVQVGGYLYGFDNATLKCLDAEDGTLQWAKRGFGKGSLLAAGDLLLVLSDNGRVGLVRATPTGYVEWGLFQATSGKSWTAPSLADGRLYVRDLDELAAFDLTQLQEAAPAEEAAAAATGGAR